MSKREFSVPLFIQLVNNVPKSKKEAEKVDPTVNAKSAILLLGQATDRRPHEADAK